MKLLQALNKSTFDTPPVWLMRQAGRYLPEYKATRNQAGSFFNLCDTPNLAAEVTLQPIRRYGFDAAIIFSDILVTPRALGLNVTLKEGEGPRVEQITTPDQITTLEEDPAAWLKKLNPTLEAQKLVREKLNPDRALIGFAGAPFTVALYTTCYKPGSNVAPSFKFIQNHPAAWQELLDKYVEVTIAYLKAQVLAGADCLQIFESWASLAPADQLEAWVFEPILKICRALKEAYPNVPITVFPRGLSFEALNTFVAMADGVFDCLSLDEEQDLVQCRRTWQGKVALQGNLAPAVLLKDPADIRIETQKICQKMADYPGFIFNLGHGVTPQVSPAHVAALVEAIRHPA